MLNLIDHCFGSLIWLLGVPIGSLSKHLKGQFGPCVKHVTLFIRGGQFGPVLDTTRTFNCTNLTNLRAPTDLCSEISNTGPRLTGDGDGDGDHLEETLIARTYSKGSKITPLPSLGGVQWTLSMSYIDFAVILIIFGCNTLLIIWNFMFQIFVDVSVGTGSGNTCVKIFFLVRKNLISRKLFQKNIVEMASKDVGKWVSTYLDSNLDKLLGADNNCEAQGMVEEEKEEGGDVTTSTNVLDGIGEHNIEEEVTIDIGDPLDNEMDCDESNQPGSQPLLVVKVESDSDIGQHLPKGEIDPNGEALNSGSGPGIVRPLTEEEEEAPEKKKKTRFSVQDDPMRLLCGWWFCGQEFPEWSPFLEHVMKHLDEVYIRI